MVTIHKHIWVPLLIVIAAIAVFMHVSSTITVVLIFIPGAIITYIVYLNTFYKKTPNPERILPLYLLCLGVQCIHFTEEYLTTFIEEIPKLMDEAPYPLEDWIVFNMIAYAIFIIGGIILFKKITALMVIPLFFILVGVLLNSVAHVLLSFYVGGYFPGLYSALIYIIIGPLLIKRILESTKTVTTNQKQ